MRIYQNFFGLDIGKNTFTVNQYGSKKVDEFSNTKQGIDEFINKYDQALKNSLVVLETTGGYEMQVIKSLIANNIAVHRANGRKVKNFIKSTDQLAKTDKQDAKALAFYGYERCKLLKLFQINSDKEIMLSQLMHRKNDLTKIIVMEKNRLKSPNIETIAEYITESIEHAVGQKELLEHKIQSIIDTDPILKAKQSILMTIPGIGKIISSELLILL